MRQLLTSTSAKRAKRPRKKNLVSQARTKGKMSFLSIVPELKAIRTQRQGGYKCAYKLTYGRFFPFTRLDPAYTSLRAIPSHLLRRARVAFASGDPLVVASLYTRFGVCATHRHPLFERPANYRGGTLSSSLSISRDGALSSSMELALSQPKIKLERS